MDTPLISIIVPVYNVEQYLPKCLESLRNQTYRRLEIILVDDGSSDKSGELCDRCAARDHRFSVVHQENRGVAAARNAGLAAAKGDWLGWVDSDDWIEPDMMEALLSQTMQENADIAVCGRYEEYPGRSVRRGWTKKECLNTEQALRLLLENDSMQNYLWDKLWRRSLFDGIRFPEGKTFEDVAVMYRLFEKAERVVCLPGAKYHYSQRQGSIVSDVSLSNRINHYRAAEDRYYELRDRWPQFRPLLESQCVASAVGIWSVYYQNPRKVRKAAKAELNRIAGFTRQYVGKAGPSLHFGKGGRMALRLMPWPVFSLGVKIYHLWKDRREPC